MLIPLFAWASTGVIFVTKPGYAGAYEQLAVKTYPFEASLNLSPVEDWQEVRWLRSILGVHLLIKESGAYRQYLPDTLLPAEQPSESQVKALLADAMTMNEERYGHIERVDGLTAYTSTGVTIELNWDELSLSQRGFDRSVIETLYRIHYLQWTKWESVNLFLGVAGLLLLTVLTTLGLTSYLSNRREPKGERR